VKTARILRSKRSLARPPTPAAPVKALAASPPSSKGAGGEQFGVALLRVLEPQATTDVKNDAGTHCTVRVTFRPCRKPSRRRKRTRP
jgi:hypothetical protein